MTSRALLGALVVALLVGSSGVAGAVPLDDGQSPIDRSVSDRTLGNQTAPVDDGGADGPLSSSDEQAIAPPLRDANGTVEVIVRVEPDSRHGGQASISHLKSRAEQARRPVEQFAATQSGITVDRTFWLSQALLVTVDTDRLPLDRLAGVPGVTAIHPNVRVPVTGAAGTQSVRPVPGATQRQPDGIAPRPDGVGPTESRALAATGRPNGSATGGLELINATAAWQSYDQRGGNATVAVLDTGVDPTAHPDLEPQAWSEFAMDGGHVPSEPYDPHGHGTHTSGTAVGATTPNGTHYGVAPNATLYHGKVATGSGSASYASVIAGMEWAIEQRPRPDAISLSLGLSARGLFIEPVQRARAAGTVVVVSSGNSGVGTSGSPASIYPSLSVGAVDDTGRVTDFSSGRRVQTSRTWGLYAPDDWPDEYVVPDVVAPGYEVYSAVPSGYGRMSGTSMAAPHVAGAVALLRSEHPDLTVAGVQYRLESTAEQYHGNGTVNRRAGHGVIDLTAALEPRSETVSGVVHIDGRPADNVTVRAAGYTTTTDESGAYSVRVPAGAVTVSADQFGWERASETVDSAERTRVNLSITERSPAIALSSGPDQYASPNETITTRVRVASAEELTPVVHGDPISESAGLGLSVAGQSVRPNETVGLPENASTVDVTMRPDAGYVGEVGLTLVASDGTARSNWTVGPLRIHPDPIVVPDDVGSENLQSALNIAGTGTTVRFENDERMTIPVTPNASAESTQAGPVFDTGLAVVRPMTITASPDAAPLRFVSRTRGSSTAIATIASSPQVTITNLTIEGNVTTGIANEGPSVTVRNTTVRDVTTGFRHYPLFYSLGGADAAGGSITDSQFENVSLGVDTYGPMRSISNTTVRDARTGYWLFSNGVSVRNASADVSQIGAIVQGSNVSVRDLDVDVENSSRPSRSPSGLAELRPRGLFLVTDGTVRDVDVRVDDPTAVSGIQIVESKATVSAATVRGAGVDIESVRGTTITDLTVQDAPEGLRVGAYNGSSAALPETTRNVSVSGATVSGADRAIAIENGSEATIDDARVTNGSISFGAVDPSTATVRNLSVRGSASIAASGRNVTVRRTTPPALPDDRERVSPALRATERGPSATLDLGVRDTGPIGAVDLTTLALSRYASGGWTATAAADDDRRAAADDVALPGTYALLGEPSEGLQVTAIDLPDRARPGERVRLGATVENAGATTVTDEIRYSADGVERNSTTIALAPNETRTVGLSWVVPANATLGAHTQRIAAGGSGLTAPLTVEAPTGRIAGRVLGDRDDHAVANATVAVEGPQGRTVSTNATGAFAVDGLLPDRSYTLTVERAGYTTESRTVGGNESAIVRLRQRARYLGLSAVDIGSADGSVTATATVTNLGRADWTAPIELSVDDRVVASRSITLAPGQRRTITVRHAVDAGEHTVGLASANESVATSLAVQSAPATDDSGGGGVAVDDRIEITTEAPTDAVRTPVPTTATPTTTSAPDPTATSTPETESTTDAGGAGPADGGLPLGPISALVGVLAFVAAALVVRRV
ncbi:S8 family serine peptidase [Halococcoides cellulosivorans]|uniref:Peptidase S8/S53 domain-containing protein n=1 Tax=Halococcoides cellulosivorans TaxID=1679096 RepID=A0A2R4X364_9EURY|nr:S8 family serine peptidase [Halococcoides cellulosivorans]AWB28239.1 hypothetical protein HARCEL1_11260 [Halococcoides cellulosivorans]